MEAKVNHSPDIETIAEDAVYHALELVLKLLGNANRFKILRLLEKKNLTFNQIVYELRTAPKTVSSHIKKLLDAGLIKRADKGYELTKASKALLTRSISEMIKVTRELISMDKKQQKELFNRVKKEKTTP